MNRAILLADTGPLYALADPSDQFHSRAGRELEAIEKRGLSIAVGYPALCEAYTLILRRLGGRYARQWLTQVLEGAVLINPEPGDFATAAADLERFPDHPITLADAVLAALSRRLEVRVWSFDRHFATMRAAVWH